MATGRIGTTPVLTTRWSKAPAAGTTSLSGLDDNSVSLVYSVGYEQVYLNGALLSRTNDYTATNGTTITLTNATVAGDISSIRKYCSSYDPIKSLRKLTTIRKFPDVNFNFANSLYKSIANGRPGNCTVLLSLFP